MTSYHRLYIVVTVILILILSGQVTAKTNMLFILDGSNSMWGQIDGKSKISSAQEVLSVLLIDLPADTSVGLMTYGHRDKSSCTDIELLSPIGTDNPEELRKKIKGILPKGKTPIAATLTASIDAFSKYEGESNHVVLISDGLESCDGDPCVAAGLLASANIKARVHVIGFDIGDEERKKLECIPMMGNGKYFSASNAAELKLAVAEVKKEAVEPPPPPVVVIKEYFRDDFDGEELAEHWDVMNPDPDSFIVEDNNLLLIASGQSDLTKDTVKNIFLLNEPLPEGDWIATAKIDFELATGKEMIGFGLYHDKDNYILGGGYYKGGCCPNDQFVTHNIKNSKGKEIISTKYVVGGGFAGFAKVKEDLKMPIYLKFEKKGRSFFSSLKMGDEEEAEWIDVDKVTTLRQKGKLGFMFYQYDKTNAETLLNIEWIKIEVQE